MLAVPGVGHPMFWGNSLHLWLLSLQCLFYRL